MQSRSDRTVPLLPHRRHGYLRIARTQASVTNNEGRADAAHSRQVARATGAAGPKQKSRRFDEPTNASLFSPGPWLRASRHEAASPESEPGVSAALVSDAIQDVTRRGELVLDTWHCHVNAV